ncbi:MAG: AAA family ATPase [Bullifex sp.]|nr:AAA family ATPase [Bullifex sp.]
MAEFDSVAKTALEDTMKDIKNRLNLNLGVDVSEDIDSTKKEDSFDDILKHNLFGIHIKYKNDALSEVHPHISIGWSKLGDLSGVSSIEELGEKYDQEWPNAKPRSRGQNIGQIWRFCNDVQIGDYVIFAESDVFHIGKVTSDYYYNPNEYEEQNTDYKNNRNVTWLKTNIPRSELSQAFHLSLRTAMSIWTLNDYKAAVVALLKGTYVKDLPLESETFDSELEYGLKSCLEVNLSSRTRKKHPLNFIIYGAPGTGKTYSTAEYALAIIEDKSRKEVQSEYSNRKELMDAYKKLVKEGQIVFTTFHQSYGYEEFIQGLRPDTNAENMSFKTVDGIFKRVADVALNNPYKDYVIIIDEINRANISKVFGELITLIEDDKRWGEINQTCVSLQSGDVFAVPNNLYIIGTMNSADKSISLIDAALRRRFEFIEQYPDVSLVKEETLMSVLKKINDKLADDLASSDLLIGHSYFMNKKKSDLCKILNNSVIPLLYEYYYDDKKKVYSALNIALKDLNYSIVDMKTRRLYVKEKDSSET